MASEAKRRKNRKLGGKDLKPNPGEPDYSRKCEVCQASPVLPETGMCGPCTFGEADTAGGNW